MAASSAHAAMSVNGLFAGSLTDNDGGLASTFSTNSVYVSYSDTTDNGMGVSVAMSLTAAGLVTDVNIDTGGYNWPWNRSRLCCGRNGWISSLFLT